ncbi:MAG TPA: thiamine phosphate synthase [Xanthobacteraceae bacterium]|nr:thiamine phosphate synthase [Xanthobacteraceae bacterium]
MGTARDETRAAPRLYLVTPPVADPDAVANDLADALNATDIAAVLLRLAEGDESAQLDRIKALRILIQSNGAALLLDGHAELCARGETDGAHLTGIDAFTAAAPALKPARIAGCGGLNTRHDAMLAGEAGADYVMFGEPDTGGRRPSFDAILERVEWWAQTLTIPCVAYAASLDEGEALAAAGADFIALGENVWRDARAVAAAASLGTDPVR